MLLDSRTNQRMTLSIAEAANMLGISRSLAYDLAARGELPGARRIGARRLIVVRSVLERFLEGEKPVEEFATDGATTLVRRIR